MRIEGSDVGIFAKVPLLELESETADVFATGRDDGAMAALASPEENVKRNTIARAKNPAPRILIVKETD